MKPQIRSIPRRFIPENPPVLASFAWPTILSYWHAPQWLFGVLGVVLLVCWIMFFAWLVASESIKAPPFDT